MERCVGDDVEDMRITLFLLSLFAAASGAALLWMAESPVDQIGGLMLLVVAATLLTTTAAIEAVTRCLRVAELNQEMITHLASELKEARGERLKEQQEQSLREPAYVVRTGNDSSGPFPVEKIKELRRRGAIDDDTPVALAGRNEWLRTGEVIGACA